MGSGASKVEFDPYPYITGGIMSFKVISIKNFNFCDEPNITLRNSFEEKNPFAVLFVVPEGQIPSGKLHVSYLTLPRIGEDIRIIPTILITMLMP